VRIKEMNLSSGLFRRAPILRVNITAKEKNEIVDRRLREKYSPCSEAWFRFLRNIRNIRIKEYKQIDSVLLERINEVVKSHYSQNKLLELLEINNQNTLLKFAYINSLLRGYNPLNPYNPEEELQLEITAEDVDNAINDFETIYAAIHEFTEQNIRATMHPIQSAIMAILERKQCYSSKTSAVSSSELIEVVTKALKENKATVRYHFYNVLKAKGMIETKQVGKNGSRVWLK